MALETQEPNIETTTLVDAGGVNTASISAAGALKTDSSAVTQPVSGTIAATQSGAWTTGRTWALVSGGDSVASVQSGVWSTGRTWALSNATDSVAAVQSGTWTVQQGTPPWSVSQSGAWTTGRTWTLASGTDSIAAVQSGTWTVQPGNTPNTSPWLIEQRAPGIATYSASVLTLVAAATPTDIFTLYGSGTKTVKIIRIEVSATQNTAAVRDIVLIKRSATNTGGTSSAATAVPHDSTNAAATATALSYTANPAALGASVGNIRTAKLEIPATNLVGNTDRMVWDFANRPGQAIVLRGTSQGIAINMNGVTSANNSFDIAIEWTEE